MKKEEFSQYQITECRGKAFVPAAEREQYFPILFIEPSEKHIELLGFDLGSLPECLAAMDRAKAKTGPAITCMPTYPDWTANPNQRSICSRTAHNELSA